MNSMLQKTTKLHLIRINYGEYTNKIPDGVYFEIASDMNKDAVETEVKNLIDQIKKEHPLETKVSYEMASAPITSNDQYANDESMQTLLKLLDKVRAGVIEWKDTTVMTSQSIGYIKDLGNAFKVGTLGRSAIKEAMDQFTKNCSLIATETGSRCVATFEDLSYPWVPQFGSDFQTASLNVLKKYIKTDIEVTAMHVGLEPAVVMQNYPYMEAVAIGGGALNPHNVGEFVMLNQSQYYSSVIIDILQKVSLEDIITNSSSSETGGNTGTTENKTFKALTIVFACISIVFIVITVILIVKRTRNDSTTDQINMSINP